MGGHLGLRSGRAAATYHHQPAAGVGLSFLTLALGQSIGGSVLGSLMSMSGAGTAFAAAAAAAALSALLPPSRLVSARTEEMNVLTQEQIRAHAERRSSS